MSRCFGCNRVGHKRRNCPTEAGKYAPPPKPERSLGNEFEIAQFIMACGEGKYLSLQYSNGRSLSNYVNKHTLSTTIRVLKTLPKDLSCTLVHCPLLWRDVLCQLQQAGKLKYEMVAEDKRSGANLPKILEIEGWPVTHDPLNDHVSSEKCSFRSRLTALYKELTGEDADVLTEIEKKLEVVYLETGMSQMD